MTNIKINREYKDRLFKKIFEEDKANLLSLYNALNKTNYTDEEDLTVTTIDDVIYMGMKNDVSCLIGNHLSLFEQQSTVNPNMPLRGFLYFGKLYEKYLVSDKTKLYGKTLKKIPTPEFYVLYNGNEDLDDVSYLRLSDAFEVPDHSGNFEWTATVININQGHSKELMKACKALQDYSMFVATIKRNLRTLSLEEAVTKAVDECIEADILTSILKENKVEVIGMILTEYNEKEVMEGLAEEKERIQAVINMLKLGISEEKIKEFYPREFEEGLKRFRQLNLS